MFGKVLIVFFFLAAGIFNAAAQSQPMTDEQFRRLPAEINSLLQRMTVLENKIDELKKSAVQGSNVVPIGVSSGSTSVAQHDSIHIKYPTLECPKGQYVAGLRAWGATSGGGKGDLTGVTIYCRSVFTD
jgi:hypothetical protein